MAADKEDKFDEMLGRTLREDSESVPVDFTERVLRQIRQAQEQRILARVVMQERLALAGCIALGIVAIAGAMVFPSIARGLTEQVVVFVNKISQAIEAVSCEWLFYAVFVGVFGFAVYALVDLLVGD